MRVMLVFALCLFNSSVFAQESRAPTPTEEATRTYKEEIDKLSSFELLKELERLDSAQTAKALMTGNPFDVDPKALAFTSALEERRKKTAGRRLLFWCLSMEVLLFITATNVDGFI